MRLVSLTTAALLAALTVSPLAAEDCDPVTVQNLNSKAQSEIVILETSDIDQGTRDKLEAIKADFQEANTTFSQATDTDDRDEIMELCPVFEDINQQLEALKN